MGTVKDLDLDKAFSERKFKEIADHFNNLLDEVGFDRAYGRRVAKAEELGLPIPPKRYTPKSHKKRQLVVERCTANIINKLGLQEQMFNLKVQVARLYVKTNQLYEIDHVYPICGHNYTGLHVPWNLEVIPARENRKKYNKSPEEWQLEKKMLELLGKL